MATEKKSAFNKEKWLPLVYTPFRISHRCCGVMKKSPLKKYQHANKVVPILGTMAEESRVRRQGWIRTGCNAFDDQHPSKSKSTPMAFWTEQDVLRYIVQYGLTIPSVYGDIVAVDADGIEYDPKTDTIEGCKLKTTGCERTGCTFCAFGLHMEKGETRFERLKRTHPKQYDFCMRGGQWIDNPDYVPGCPEYDGIWKNWNPEKIWVPGNGGLGFEKVFEMCNEIYGDGFYRW